MQAFPVHLIAQVDSVRIPSFDHRITNGRGDEDIRHRSLLEKFDFVMLEHVPRKDNQMVDALANLAATLVLTKDEVVNLPVCQRWVVPLALGASQEGVNFISVLSIDVDDWRQTLIDYLEHGKLPDESRHRSEVRRRAPQFIY
ncbi:hypothetical protein L3X38_011387 [Prunus dulcis]|uniref:RNase H type-1 domain-containing protein n=1 Tax=Prunus dulcis TaxID=3755 RepID=A0AAD4WI03_PRUDU|nr:hypothetical protein L3X38_011387 [Prunus dulcis]